MSNQGLFLASLLVVLSLLGPCHSAMVNITWQNKLTNQQDLDAFLTGPDGVVCETVTLHEGGTTVLMGYDPKGELTFKDALVGIYYYNQNKTAEEVKYIKIDVNFQEVFAQMDVILNFPAFRNAYWIMLHFDYFRGPGGALPNMNPAKFKDDVVPKLPYKCMISFGIAMNTKEDLGYTELMLRDVTAEWNDYGFRVIYSPFYKDLKKTFMLHIVHLSHTPKKIVTQIAKFVDDFYGVELRLAKEHLPLVNYTGLKEVMDVVGYAGVWMNVPPEFHSAFQEGGMPTTAMYTPELVDLGSTGNMGQVGAVRIGWMVTLLTIGLTFWV